MNKTRVRDCFAPLAMTYGAQRNDRRNNKEMEFRDGVMSENGLEC